MHVVLACTRAKAVGMLLAALGILHGGAASHIFMGLNVHMMFPGGNPRHLSRLHGRVGTTPLFLDPSFIPSCFIWLASVGLSRITASFAALHNLRLMFAAAFALHARASHYIRLFRAPHWEPEQVAE